MKCFFCIHKAEPSYKDIDNLKKFTTARAKIMAREHSGICASHQRELSKQIKYARYLALLPYISYRHKT